MKVTQALIVCLLLCSSIKLFSQDKQVQDLVIGERISLHSKILNEERTINVLLPDGYADDTSKTYPVIYVLDGGLDEDFLHIAGLIQYGSLPWVKLLPPSIVVGICNVDRKKDFTYPTQSKKLKKKLPTSGGSAKFIEFIEKELQVMVDKSYRCAANRTLIGQSLGGLVASEILIKKPQLFDNYIIVSPSIWWDDESLLKMEVAAFNSHKDIYIAVGDEGKKMERGVRFFFDKLKVLRRENASLYYHYFKDLHHGNILHKAVYDAFEQIHTPEK